MALRIACLVLALPIGLIDGFVLDPCTGRPRTSEVGVDVGNMNDDPGASHVHCVRRSQLVLGCDPVEPNSGTSDTDFAMDCLAVGRPFNASGFEAERLDQEVVSTLDVAIHQQGDKPLKCGHESFSCRTV